MTKVFTKEEVFAKKEFFIQQIQQGKTFFYPTDTVYGLGCSVTHTASIKKIFSLKQRGKNAVSIIVPNKEWITTHCRCEEKYLALLPGPYTLLVEPKGSLDLVLVQQESPLLGVRIPKNWFCDLVREAGCLFVTTSANLSGKPTVAYYEQLDKSIYDGVDFIIDDGVKDSKASTVIHGITGEIIRS